MYLKRFMTILILSVLFHAHGDSQIAFSRNDLFHDYSQYAFDVKITQNKTLPNTAVIRWYPQNPEITGYKIQISQVGNALLKIIDVGQLTSYVWEKIEDDTKYEISIIGYDVNLQKIATSFPEKFALKPETIKKTTRLLRKVIPESDAKLKILSLSESSFKVVSNLLLTTSNLGEGKFDSTHFKAFEDTRLQTDNFKVTGPNEFSEDRIVDFVFIIDNSGSMEPEHRQVLENVDEFVKKLEFGGVKLRLGLVRFGQAENWGRPILVNDGNLTDNVETFKEWIGEMTSDGGFEPGIEAIHHAATQFHFRSNSFKHFLLITDEDSDRGDLDTTLNVCTDKYIMVHCAVDSTYGESYSQYGDPATSIRATGGILFPVLGPYNKMFDLIVPKIIATYVVSYKSDNPVFDSKEREVVIEFSYLQHTASDTGYYTPGAAPKIDRTLETRELSNSSQPAGTKITIAANITDTKAPLVHTASLYYRQQGKQDYDSVQVDFTPADSFYFSADIPESFVVPYGVEYYIKAADADITITDPLVDAALQPYKITVDNPPPIIVHTPIETAFEGFDIAVNCIATDNTNYLDSVKLHYRKTGTATYGSVNMNLYSSYPDSFRGTIPDSLVTVDGVDYYISATDDSGLTGYHGTSSEPHQIAIIPDIPKSILIVGREGAKNDSILKSLGYTTAYHEDVCVLNNFDLSTIDQIWYCEYRYLPNSEGRTNVANFLKSGGNIFFVGEIMFAICEKMAAWRDSLLNSLGAGGIEQCSGHLWDCRPFEFAANQDHPITAGIPCIGHETASYGAFENVGNGTWVVKDAERTDKPISVAFDKGDLRDAADSRVVIYLNSNCTKNWTTFVTNMALWFESPSDLSKPRTDESGQTVPMLFAFSQNYPNPFNPDTRISYQLPQKSHVKMTIYNCMGQEIRNLVNKTQAAGTYETLWDGLDEFGNDTPSGVYFYTICSGRFYDTKKMIKLK